MTNVVDVTDEITKKVFENSLKPREEEVVIIFSPDGTFRTSNVSDDALDTDNFYPMVKALSRVLFNR